MRSISVVMSIYNGDKYFDRGVASILKQDHDEFEFLIVDDGSTDNTGELLSELETHDKRVRVHRPGRLGLAAALNYGVARATGEYIAKQDVDDVSYSERLGKQAAFLDDHPEVGLVGGHYYVIDDNRGERFLRMPPTEHEDVVRAMAKYIPFAHTLTMFRKAAWEEAGGYPDTESIVDLGLWVSIARQGWRVANLADVLGEHWIYSDSFFHRAYDYRTKQRRLASVQWRAVRELGLPMWMGVYPVGRYVYGVLPTGVKRAVRRTVGGMRERDVVGGL
jgi:glycosyltransferase EpsE